MLLSVSCFSAGAFLFMYVFGIDGVIGNRRRSGYGKGSYLREKVRELEAEKERERGDSD